MGDFHFQGPGGLPKRSQNVQSNSQHKILIQKINEKNLGMMLASTNYTKAFDCVNQNLLWETRNDIGIPSHLTHPLKNMYTQQTTIIWCNGVLSHMFHIEEEHSTGQHSIPLPVNLYGEWRMCAVLENTRCG